MPPAEPPVIEVLALQGDVAEHLRALEQAGARPPAVRGPAELDRAAGLIIPGGESTAISARGGGSCGADRVTCGDYPAAG